MTIEEKIRIIEETESFADVPSEVLPTSYKESYYFISYSHKDYKMVLSDILRLEALGVNVWYDKEMHIGENWREIAQLYISKFQCAGVIFYLTENSISSPACNQEVEYVLTHDKNFLSINKALSGRPVESGEAMLRAMKERGLPVSDALLASFHKAFGNEILYLDAEASIEKKAEQILSIPREDLLQIEKKSGTYLNDYRSIAVATACKDNTVISLDLSKIYSAYSNGEALNAPIEALGDCLFTNAVKLQSVKVSDKLLEIGESAFRNCISLTDIDLSRTHGLSIGKSAFKNCKALKDIDLSGVAKIEEEAFCGCSSLDKLTIGGSIGFSAFMGTPLTEVTLTAERLEIAHLAFTHCQDLKRVSLRGGFEGGNLGRMAFEDCTALEEIDDLVAPRHLFIERKDGVYFGSSAFSGCKALKKIRLSGIWNISAASYAFCRCSSMQSIELDIDEKFLVAIPDKFVSDCTRLVRVSGLEKVKEIGDSAFEKCESFKTADLSSVEILKDAAFCGSGLERVYLPRVKTVGKSAFATCKSLESIHIGRECRELGDFAFLNCPCLKTLKILSENLVLGERGSLFDYTEHIETVYLRSETLLGYIIDNGALKSVTTFYLGENLADYVRHHYFFAYKETESDENGFIKLVHRYKEPTVEEVFEEELDLSAAELNEPDPYREKISLGFPPEILIGGEALIKHSRLKKAYPYFVEAIKKDEDGALSSLTVSVHSGKSFLLDASLIESVEDVLSPAVSDFRIDAQYYLKIVGRECCIGSNGEYHYATVTSATVEEAVNGAPLCDENGKCALVTLAYEEDGAIKAVAGEDVALIVIYNQDHEPEMIYQK